MYCLFGFNGVDMFCIDFGVRYAVYHVIIILFDCFTVIDAVADNFNCLDAVEDDNNYILSKENK